MKKTAIIYSFNSVKSAKIAEKIQAAFNDKAIKMINAEDISEKEFLAYDNYVLGVPTWFDGELPNYWDEFVPALEDMKLKGKTFALYGLGDQKGYPENFLDAVGILGDILEQQGGRLVGFTSINEYTFESSKALRGDKFMGLAIDFENQGKMNNERVKSWVEQLKKEFG
ncbi:MAG: flavodoxin [Bacteroidales bacterium]|nr:flavodoxin [Bacteroidales bacterium]